MAEQTQPERSYSGSRPMQRGVFAAPRIAVIDIAGRFRRSECGSCGRSVPVGRNECECGVALLGKQTRVER
jgi:hypothetical protein